MGEAAGETAQKGRREEKETREETKCTRRQEGQQRLTKITQLLLSGYLVYLAGLFRYLCGSNGHGFVNTGSIRHKLSHTSRVSSSSRLRQGHVWSRILSRGYSTITEYSLWLDKYRKISLRLSRSFQVWARWQWAKTMHASNAGLSKSALSQLLIERTICILLLTRCRSKHESSPTTWVVLHELYRVHGLAKQDSAGQLSIAYRMGQWPIEGH